jgi:hypothetical protein
MSRATMRRRINREIRLEQTWIREWLGLARVYRQRALTAISRGESAFASTYFDLEQRYTEMIEREMRAIDGKMKIREVVDEAEDDYTDMEIYALAKHERQFERERIRVLREQANDLATQGSVLLARGKNAQGLAKLRQAQEKLAKAEAEEDTVAGKNFAISELLLD